MGLYWINSSENICGNYEVHKETCEVLPAGKDMFLLGKFPSCEEAIIFAKEKYHPLKEKIKGCTNCYQCDNCSMPCKIKAI